MGYIEDNHDDMMHDCIMNEKSKKKRGIKDVEYVRVNSNVARTEFHPLEGTELKVKKRNKTKTTCYLFGTTISLKNEYLDEVK